MKRQHSVDGIQYDELLFGDIVFVSSQNNVAALLTKFRQRISGGNFSASEFLPTHVGIVVDGSGKLFHSASTGVHFSHVVEYVNTDQYSAEIKAFRNLKLEEKLDSDPLSEEILRDDLYQHFGKKYNYLGSAFQFNMDADPETLEKASFFCSELAVDFLMAANLLVSLDSSKIYPYKLLEIVSNQDEWRELNPLCIQSLDKNKTIQRYQRIITSLRREKSKNYYENELKERLSLIDNQIKLCRLMTNNSNSFQEFIKKYSGKN